MRTDMRVPLKISAFLNLITEYLIYLSVFLPPIIFLKIWAGDWYDITKFFTVSFLSGLVIFLIGANLLMNKRYEIRSNKVLTLYILYLAAFLISGIFSVHPRTSFLGGENIHLNTFFHQASLLLLSFSIHIWLADKKDRIIDNLSLYISLGGLLVAVFGLAGLFYDLDSFLSDRLRSTMGQPNKLAFYLIAVLPVSVSLLSAKELLNKLVGVSSAVTIFAALVLTYSRSAWLTFVLGISVIIFTRRKIFGRFITRPSIIIAAVILLFLLIISIRTETGQKVKERIITVKEDFQDQSGSIYLRLADLHSAVKLYLDQPVARKIIGIGPATSGYFLTAYRDPQLNNKRTAQELTQRPYFILNQYLQTTINTGIAGLILLLATVFFTLRHFLKNSKFTYPEIGLFAAFIMIVISGLVYADTAVTSLMFWILVPFLWLKTDYRLRINIILPLFFMVSGLIVFSFSSIYAMAEYISFNGNFEKAIKLMPFFDKYYKDYANVYTRIYYETKNRADIEKAMNLSNKAYDINPLEINNLESVQKAFFAAGVNLDKSFHQTASLIGEKRNRLSPSYADSFDSLGQVYLDTGELDKALENFETAIKVDPDFRMAYLHAGEVYKQKGDFDAAEKNYRTALDRFPNYSIAADELDKLNILKTQKDQKSQPVTRTWKEDLELFMQLTGEWFLKNQTKEGDFVYERTVATGEEKQDYDITHQAGSLYSLAQLYIYTHDQEINTTLERGYEFFNNNTEEQPLSPPTFAVKYNGNIKSETGAFLLLSLIEYMEKDSAHKEKYSEFAENLANYLVFTQRVDGKFINIKEPDETESDLNNSLSFYALVRMYKLMNEERYLKSAIKAANYFIRKYGNEQLNLSFFSWGMSGFAYLYKIEPSNEYWDFIKDYTEKFFAVKGKSIEEYFTNKSNNPPTAGLGVFLEGLSHVAWIAKEKDPMMFLRLARFNRQSLEYLLTLQVDSPKSTITSPIEEIKGGICFNQNCETINIDTTHRNLSAVYSYLAYIHN